MYILYIYILINDNVFCLNCSVYVYIYTHTLGIVFSSATRFLEQQATVCLFYIFGGCSFRPKMKATMSPTRHMGRKSLHVINQISVPTS